MLIGQRNRATAKIRQLEGRRGNAGLQPFPLDQALRERTLARQAPAPTSNFLCELGNLARSHGDGLRDSALLVDEVRHRCSHPSKPFDGFGVGLKKHGAVEAVCLHERTVALGTAVADEDEFGLPSPQIRLQAGEVGRDFLAEPALGTPMDEQNARLEVLQPHFLTMEIRQPEGREGGREWEATPSRIDRRRLESVS